MSVIVALSDTASIICSWLKRFFEAFCGLGFREGAGCDLVIETGAFRPDWRGAAALEIADAIIS